MAGEGKTGIYLLRHGQTEWSRDGRHTGRSDIPLTSKGEELARSAGRTLAALRGDAPPALVLSSPRERAVRTAALAGLTVGERTEQLAEWDYGDYEGLTTPQTRESVPGWTVWTHPCPNGETADAVGERARQLLDHVRPALADGDVVLIGHGHFSRVLVAAWLGLPATQGVSFGMDAAAVSVLGNERGVPQIQHLNVPAGAEA